MSNEEYTIKEVYFPETETSPAEIAEIKEDKRARGKGRPVGAKDSKKRIRRCKKDIPEEEKKNKRKKQMYELTFKDKKHICKTYKEIGEICGLSSAAIFRLVNDKNTFNKRNTEKWGHLKDIEIIKL